MKKPLLLVAIATFVVASIAVWSSWSTIVANIDFPSDAGNPDMPSVFKEVKNELTREEYLIQREEGAALRRGIAKGQKLDPKLRSQAIVQMESQEAKLRLMPETSEKDSLLAAWTAIGPAPIPNGQTTTNSVAVTGRTTAIAIHPTNPNIVYVGTAQGGVYRTTNGGTNWTPIFDNAQSLAIGALAIAPSQPETLYVGTGEPTFSASSFFGVGLYRIDSASTTATLNGPFGAAQFAGRAISEIIVHPTIPGTIFLGSTSGIGGVRAIGIVGPARGVFRSTNATTVAPTFVKDGVNSGGASDHNVRDLSIDPTNPNVLLVASTSFGILRFTNALTDFTTGFSQPCAACGGGALEITSQRSGGANNATFYVVGGAGSGTIYRSADGGVTWTTQSNTGFCSGQCGYNLAVAVDPTNPDNVYVGGQATAPNGVITARSSNAGVNFTTENVNLHADTHAIEVAPSNASIVWTGNDGGIWKSTDAGDNYTSMNVAPFSATQFMNIDVHPTDDNFTIGGTQDNGTNFYRPNETWTRADFGDGGWAVIDQNAANTTNVRMYHTYFNVAGLQGYGTVNNTANASDGMWAFRGCQAAGTTVNGITCNGVVNFYAPLERGPGNPNTIYYGSDRLYRSTDEGLNHTVVSQNPIVVGPTGVPISSIGISPQNDNVRIVGLNNGGLFGTSTGANPLVDLDPANAIPNNVIGKTIIDPTVQTTAYVTLVAFGVPNVWRTNDVNGLADNLVPTWADISGTGGANPLPQVPANAILKDPLSNNIYVGTDIGAYISVDNGANWMPFGTGLPRVAVFDIKLTPNRNIRIGTHGKGLFQTPALLPPTAAAATVSGRVLTTSGRGIGRAVVSVSGQTGQIATATSNLFGYYSFEGLPVGETYTFIVSSKQYQFTPRTINLEDNMLNFNLVAAP